MGVLIAILTFLVVVIVFLGIWIFASTEGTQEQVRKRMSAVHKAEKRGEAGVGLKLVRDEMMSSVPWMNQLMMKWSWSTRLQDYLTQAGMTVKPAKLLLTSGVLGFGAYLIANYFLLHFFFAFPIAVGSPNVSWDWTRVSVRTRSGFQCFSPMESVISTFPERPPSRIAASTSRL